MPARDLLNVNCEKLRPTTRICVQESITFSPRTLFLPSFCLLRFVTVHQASGIVDNFTCHQARGNFDRAGCLCGFGFGSGSRHFAHPFTSPCHLALPCTHQLLVFLANVSLKPFQIFFRSMRLYKIEFKASHCILASPSLSSVGCGGRIGRIELRCVRIIYANWPRVS